MRSLAEAMAQLGSALAGAAAAMQSFAYARYQSDVGRYGVLTAVALRVRPEQRGDLAVLQELGRRWASEEAFLRDQFPSVPQARGRRTPGERDGQDARPLRGTVVPVLPCGPGSGLPELGAVAAADPAPTGQGAAADELGAVDPLDR